MMLKRENLQALYPLSPMQEGMLFHALRDPDSAVYVEQLSFRMHPAPASTTLVEVWNALYRRHDILRTVFVHETGDRPLQAVLKEAAPRLRFEDLSALAPEEQEAHLAAWKEADRLAGFRLTEAPPSRIVCFALGGGVAEVVFTHHHILMDGWCLGILQEEFLAALQAAEAGTVLRLPPPTPYSRYIEWIGARDTEAARRFWRASLAVEDEVLASPLREAGATAPYPARHSFTLEAKAGAALRAIGLRAGATQATVLHALWGLLLGRLLDRDVVTFGSVIANRPEEIPGIDGMLGLFINTVPVRLAWGAEDSFLDLLGRLQAELLVRRPHEHLPLSAIQAEAGGRVLFDHLLLVQNAPFAERIDVEGARIERVELVEQTHYGLAVTALPGSSAGGPVFRLDFDASRLPQTEAQRIERLIRHLVGVLIAEPERPLALLPLAPPGAEAIVETEGEAPPATITALFAAAVAKHGGAEAVRCEGRSLSFSELDAIANAIAHRLREALPLGADDRVALLARRSELLPAAILGIAKSGAAYVPVDPEFPAERIGLLCRESGARLVLAVHAPGVPLPEAAMDAIPADLPVVELHETPAPSPTPPLVAPVADDLIYVTYTSGSTGQPKGVMIPHRAVAQLAPALHEVFGLTAGEHVLALTTATFDISVLELVCSLVQGLTVVMATEAVAADPDLILGVMEADSVTVLQATPSRIGLLLDAAGDAMPRSLRTILVGGERLPPTLAARLLRLPGVTSFNVYGPTETTIWSSAQRLGRAPLSIGRPLPGESLAIISRNGRPCLAGVVGEICIGGVGLSRGYLNMPELTASRHLPHPTRIGKVLYRTGDLGMLRDDGEVEILGRADDQLKLRGYRIEPGEIEALLGACPGVRRAIVSLHGEGGGAELVAHVAAAAGTSPEPLRAALARQLPAWMVPAHIVVLDSLPLLPSGKVDRGRLPAPQAAPRPAAEPPQDALEARLAELFAEVLGCVLPGRDEDFFALGGHSLLAVNLLGRLRREFSREIALRDVLRAPTVRELASVLRNTAAAARAIPRLADAPSYALSPAQRRMWVLEQMLPGSAYILPAAFEVTGPLDLAQLQTALDALAARHEALRSLFPLDGDEPRQVVVPAAPVVIEVFDVGQDAAGCMRAFFSRPFALEREPPLRVGLLRQGPGSHKLLVALHHIAADGQSLAVLQRDLSRLYGAAPGRAAPAVPKLRPRDVAAWQNQLLAGPESEVDRRYWLTLLAGELPASALIPDHPRPVTPETAGTAHFAHLGLVESNALHRLARAAGATPFMAVCALVALLLYRHGERDLRLGFPVAGRTHPDLQDVVGVFINTLVLRLRPDAEAGFAELLAAAKAGVLGALAHQNYPFDRLVEDLGIPRDPGRAPIFDVLVAWDERGGGALQLGSLEVEPLRLPVTDARFDLTFTFAEAEEGGVSLSLEYRTALFTPERIERFVGQLRSLLRGLADRPDCAIGALPLLCAEDRAVIAAANATKVPLPPSTLAMLLLDQASSTPEAIAVTDGMTSLSYRDLVLGAGGVAESLSRIEGVQPGACVALLAERGTPAILGLFGIVLSGAAWVPLDPALPEARMRALLADSACRAIVAAGPELAARAAALGGLPILDVTMAAPAAAPPAPPKGVGPDSLAYVLYTSGTTGVPKGVMIRHGSAVNLACWMKRELFGELPTSLRHAGMASLSFDACLQEILGALHRGDTLVMVPPEVKRDPRLLDKFLWQHDVAVVGITPSQLSAALDGGLWAERCSVRVLEIGAETLTRGLVDKLLALPHRRGIAVYNVYGPTECCVDSLFHRIEQKEANPAVPVGRPVANMRAYLLDERLQPVPPGAAGELCLAGAGVGLGYLGRPELTAGRFIALPQDPGERIYRTGDLAVQRGDGTLLFLGRRDEQVKIRGYRIELAEIEHHLLRIPGLRDVAVLPEGGTAEALACWYVGEPDCTPEALRTALTAVLPPWMVPSSFTPVAALPLTLSGKLDRAALPTPLPPIATHDPPQGPTEQLLQAIWQDVLGCGPVGREDDFFAVGGHSLKAIRLVADIRARFGVELPLSAVFAHPTLAGLAALLPAATAGHPAPSIARIPDQPDYPLTPAQRRLWLLEQGNRDANAAYVLVAAFELHGVLDLRALDAAATRVVTRHEALRSCFVLRDGMPRCVVLPPGPVTVAFQDVSNEPDPMATALAACRIAVSEPFDLAIGPLLRLGLWSLAKDETHHLLLVALHHIVGDGQSMAVLMRDLDRAYAAERGLALALPPLPFQARDIAAHETALRELGTEAAGLAYWRDRLVGPPLVLELPTDHPRPPQRSFAGGTLALSLSEPVSARLEVMARGLGVSLFVLLAALAKVQLHRLTGQSDIVVGSVVTSRDLPGMDEQIGFHVETVALRDWVAPDMPFIALAQSLRCTLDEAVEHRRCPFDEVVAALEPPRDPSRSPIFDVMLVPSENEETLPGSGGLRTSPVPLVPPVSKLDLTFHLGRNAHGISLALEYRADLFEEARISRMLEQFASLAESLTELGPEAPLRALRLLPDAEKALIANCSAGPILPIPDGGIAEAFAAMACNFADRPAIVTPSGIVTYAALDAMAEEVAATLKAAGIVRGEAVLVALDRGTPFLAALLGTLKAGGVYMPADPQTPAIRLMAMLRRSRARLAFAETSPPGMIAKSSCGNLRLFSAPGMPPSPLDSHDPAYVIFTSGSTGEPKGVVLGHRGFRNTVARMSETMDLKPEDRVLLFASPAFDASMVEVFHALLNGAALVPAPAATIADADAFLALMRGCDVTVATLPPAYLAALGQPDLGRLRLLLTAGEPPISADLRYYAARLNYINAYGPTEASVCATIWVVPQADWKEAELPIGAPIGNTRLHILDADLEEVPIGVPGEICLSGAGLAECYLDDPEATARAFVEWRGTRLYRTGDRGIWRADGLASYSGRLDQQVKIRGQRVEPAEIEAALMAEPEVAQAVILARGEEADRHLVAWIAPRVGKAQPSVSALRARLAATLPRAMVPRHLVWVPALPRTVNGKIDRAALPEPQPGPEAPDDVPQGPQEATLAEAFARVLGRERVGRHDDFFEFGGDSIRLLQLTIELRRQGFAFDIAEAYQGPSVAALAARLRRLAPIADQGPVIGQAPLAAPQAWFLRHAGNSANHFNQAALLRLTRRVTPWAIQAGLEAVRHHHDALRMRIVADGCRQWMEFDPPGPPPALDVIDLGEHPAADEAMEAHAQAMQRSLDVARGRMLAAALFRLREDDALFLVIHHLCVDAVSWRILLEDLGAAIEAAEAGRPLSLPPKTHAFRDWSEQQARIASSTALAAEREYWEATLRDAMVLPRGPERRRRAQRSRWRLAEFTAPAAISEPALLAAFARALAPRLGCTSMVVTLEGHGREPIAEGLDVTRSVGWFTSLYPVRLEPNAAVGVEAVAAVAHRLAEVPNRGVGYGILAELGGVGAALRPMLGGVAFNYLGEVGAPAGTGLFAAGIGSLGDIVNPDATALFNIDLLASRQGETLHLTLTHDPEILSEATAAAVLDAMRTWLASLVGLTPFPAQSTVRPYIRRVADDAPLVLGAGGRNLVFAMPPLFGYGAAFRNFAALLPDTEFHAFDFFEDEHRVERYVEAVRTAMAGRPAVVLGYSGGGNLGFAVAKAATRAGCPPVALVLLDSPLKRHVIKTDNAEIEAQMMANLDYFRVRMESDDDYRAYVHHPELRALMLRRMERFIRYLNDLVDDGQIGADIHLIRSDQDWATAEAWKGWGQSTTGRFVLHQGSGAHAHMTEGEHALRNARIVANILASLTTACYETA